MSAGWLWEMRSAIVARVHDRNPMEVADDLGGPFLAITSVWPTTQQEFKVVNVLNVTNLETFRWMCRSRK